jgi:hydrogenase 3 maturation protease
MKKVVARLEEFLKGAKRVVVVGVGNEMRGDDGAGVALARKLKKIKKLTAIEGGVAPENITIKIKRLKPSHLIFVDAADFGGKPGEVIVADPSAIIGKTVSTHTLPLSLMAEYLKHETGARILVLGIQPEHAIFGCEMSQPVKKAVEKLAAEIAKALG